MLLLKEIRIVMLISMSIGVMSCSPWYKYSTANYGDQKQLHFSGYYSKFKVAPKSKKIKVKDEIYYSWFAGDRMIETQGGYSENLLHGEYIETYNNKNLKQKGIYHKGRKTGVWRRWAENGELLEISEWKKGKKQGRFIVYENGVQVSETHYKKNLEVEPKEKKEKEEKTKKKPTKKDKSKKDSEEK